MPIQLNVARTANHIEQEIVLPGANGMVVDISEGNPNLYIVHCEADDSGQNIFKLGEDDGLEIDGGDIKLLENITFDEEHAVFQQEEAGELNRDSIFREQIITYDGKPAIMVARFIGGLSLHYVIRFEDRVNILRDPKEDT